MEKLSKHPITLLIIGSIITYLLIPQLQEKSIKRKAIAEYEVRLTKANHDISFEFHEMLVLFENFAWEVGKDSINSEQLVDIQKSYLNEAKKINSRIHKLYFDTKNLRDELYLLEYHSDKDASKIDYHFAEFYKGINASINEGKALIDHCLRNSKFIYDDKTYNMISSRRSSVAKYDAIQYNHLKLICGILNN